MEVGRLEGAISLDWTEDNYEVFVAFELFTPNFFGGAILIVF
jgi:hypothetical protein